ncbi:MAG TPA: peptidoglycan-associated lipoprotein Pal [Vicinamibacteria bacterium]
MRQYALVAAVAILAVGLTGCPKKPQPVTPTEAPAVPATPPPAPAPPPEAVPQKSEYDTLKETATDVIDKMGLLGDIHFEYDKADIRAEDQPILAKNAETLKKFDFLLITIEGHCDERGSVEYNLALGERRAKAAQEYLVSLGVPADRMKTTSLGKEVPLCQESNEECWARNRRDHFSVTGKR